MLFALIANLIFFFLVLFADASYGSFILLFASFILLVFSPKLLSKDKITLFFKDKFFRIIFLFIFVFLLIASFSLFYTISIPFSIDRLVKLYFSFVVFFFFLFLKNKYLDKESIFSLLNILFLTLGFLVIVFMFFPEWGDLLPGMNLLFTSYGHNHFAALVLLFLPIFFFQFTERPNNFYLFLIVFSYFLVALSSARIVMFLSVFEFLFFVSRRNFYLLNQNYKKRLILTIFLLIFLLILMLIFTFLPKNSLSFICESGFKSFCKDFSNEGRQSYWSNSISIFRNNFFWGSGLNTYVLESKKYLHYGDSITSFAHNEFLQVFSDLGLFGGLSFLILFLLMLLKAFLVKKTTLSKYLLIALIFIFFNVFFDFDWQFLSVFILTLIYFSIIFRNGFLKSNEKVKKRSNFSIFYYLLLVIVFIVSSLSVLSIFLINKNKNLAFDVYPYSIFQKNDFLGEEILSEKRQLKLEKIYENDSFFIVKSLKNKNDLEKINSYKKVIDYYPLIISFSDFSNDIDGILNEDNYLEISELIFEIVDYLDQEQIQGFETSDDFKNMIASYLLRLTTYAYKDKNWQLLGQIYYKYSRIFINLPIDFRPSFLNDKSDKNHYDLLLSMEEFNPHLYFSYSEEFKSFYLRVAEDLIFAKEYEKAYLLYSRMSAFTNDFVWSGDITDYLMADLLKSSSEEEFLTKFSYFIDFYLSHPQFFWNYFSKRDISNRVILYADGIYEKNKTLALRYYAYAHALDEWNLLESDSHFNELDLEAFEFFKKTEEENEDFKFFINYFIEINKNDPNFEGQVRKDFYYFLNKN